MKALIFLLVKTTKNRLLALKKHPSLLVLYLILAVFLVIAVCSSVLMGTPETDELLIPGGNVGELFGALAFVVLLLFGCFNLWSGLSSGGDFFTVSDVHLLFPAPISPKRILFYGLSKRMAASLLLCVLVFFQTTNIRLLTGAEPFGAVALALGILLVILVSQLGALVIYQFSNGNRLRKYAVMAVLSAGLLSLAGAVLWAGHEGGFSAAVSLLSGDAFSWIPLVGWAKAFSVAVYFGNAADILLFGGLLLLLGGAMLLVLFKCRMDYYEDVMDGAQRRQQIQQMQKETGSNMQALRVGKKVRIRDTGLRRGAGASALFFRQMRESSRRALRLIDTTTIFTAALALFVVLISRSEDEMDTAISLLIGLGMACYMYLFFSMTGAWANEIKRPYIYLIPQPAVKKLFYASLSSLIKSMVDGAVIFLLFGILLQTPAWQTALCAVTFGTFGFVFVAGDMISQRIFKRQIGNGLLRLVYFLLLGGLSLPGVIASAVIGLSLMGTGFAFWGLLASIVWNCGVYAAALPLSRGMLSSMDFA